MAATQRLAGVRIHLSGSNKELQAGIAEFVQKFAAKVFSEGALLSMEVTLHLPSRCAKLQKTSSRQVAARAR